MKPGDRFGPYEIVAPIGAGGIGDVFKARDTRLDRIVAIKVSREQFPERFEREARAVALNHPHICQLYDVGPDYLVMEFVQTPLFHDAVIVMRLAALDPLEQRRNILTEKPVPDAHVSGSLLKRREYRRQQRVKRRFKRVGQYNRIPDRKVVICPRPC